MRTLLLSIVALLGLAAPSYATETIAGRAQIADGDRLAIDGTKARIRLYGIDTATRRIGRDATSPTWTSASCRTRDGFVQGSNGQIAVNAAHQIIVVYRLLTNSADARALVPRVDDAHAHLGRNPREVSGYADETNLDALKQRRSLPIWRLAKHATASPTRPGVTN